MGRWLLLMAIIAIVLGCVRSQPPVKHATADQCVMLYHHFVALAVFNDVKVDVSGVEQATHMVDNQWQEDGKTDRFLLSCIRTMSQPQLVCALNTSRIEEVNNCIRLADRQ